MAELKVVRVATEAKYNDLTTKNPYAIYFIEDIKKIIVNGIKYGFSDEDASKFLKLTGGAMKGTIDMNSNSISNVNYMYLNGKNTIQGTSDDHPKSQGDLISVINIGTNMIYLNAATTYDSSYNDGNVVIRGVAEGTQPTDGVNLEQLESTIANELEDYLPLSGGYMDGPIDMGRSGIKNIGEIEIDSSESLDISSVASFQKGESEDPSYLNMKEHQIKNIADGTDTKDAINKGQLNSEISNSIKTYITDKLGTASGIATLDNTGKVPSSQLPSYVDDVLEYPYSTQFPTTGEAGKIYVALDSNKTYRWSGTAYVEISSSLALGETASTAYRGDRGKIAYDHTNNKSNPHGVTKSQVGLGNVANYGVATQVEAETGTVDNKYMTPLRVFQAITKVLKGTFYLGNGYYIQTDRDLSTGHNTFYIGNDGTNETFEFGTNGLKIGINDEDYILEFKDGKLTINGSNVKTEWEIVE